MTAQREPGLVVATTRRVAGPADTLDLLDWLGPDGFAWFADGAAFVTAGTAATVGPRDAVAFLQSVEHEGDAGGRGIRAVGALPFEGAGWMTVPARIVERDAAGIVWATTVAPATRQAPEASPPRGRIARRFTVEACQGLDEWDAMVTAALALVESQELEKVVLAREVVVEADAPFEPATILDRLRATQPDCYVYASGGFVGATPELLVRRSGSEVVSRPMAGTVPRAASPDEDGRSIARLVSSVKESREHRLVVDAVAGELARWCDGVVVGEPEPMRLTSVTHLTTRISGRVRRRDSSAVDLALALHPTPAVNGSPSPRSRGWSASTGPRTPGRSAGSTRGATASSRWRCAARPSTGTAHGCSPGPASSPDPTPMPSGPRPRRSSNRCCGRSSAPDRR